MVRRLRSRILIDYTGMCVKREREGERSLETTHDIAHPILVVATTSLASSIGDDNTQRERGDNKLAHVLSTGVREISIC